MALAGKLENAKVIFLMGGPGSGKGTQSGRIVAKYGLTHLSSGDLLRSEVALGSAEGKRLRRGMQAGELVPLADILRLLRDAMQARAVDSPGFVVDGYPRSVEQAVRFDAEVTPCQAVLALNVPEEVMAQRLLRRGRARDSEALIAKKLETYRRITKPAFDYYARQGKLIWIDGSGSVDEVFNRVQDGLLTFSVRHRGKSSGQGAAKAADGRGGRGGVKAHPAARQPAKAQHRGPGRQSKLSGKSVATTKSAPMRESKKPRLQSPQGGGGGKAGAGSAVVASGKGAAPVRLSGVGSASVQSGRGPGSVKVAHKVTGKLPMATGKFPMATGKLPMATGKLPMTTGKLSMATGKLQPAAKTAGPQKHVFTTGKVAKASSKTPPQGKCVKSHRT